MDELEHTKKKIKKLWKCQHFGMAPSLPVVKIHNFFFFEWILPLKVAKAGHNTEGCMGMKADRHDVQ